MTPVTTRDDWNIERAPSDGCLEAVNQELTIRNWSVETTEIFLFTNHKNCSLQMCMLCITSYVIGFSGSVKSLNTLKCIDNNQNNV